MRIRIGLSGALLFLMSLAVAQTTSTEVLGNVKIPVELSVAGAKVTLLRVQTGERRVRSTTNSGDYSFPLIERGEYTVTVDAPGFKPERKTGVDVACEQKARADFLNGAGEQNLDFSVMKDWRLPHVGEQTRM